MAYSKEALDNFTRNYMASIGSTATPPVLNPLRRQTYQQANFNTDGWSDLPPAPSGQGGPSAFARVADVLSRPLYASAGGVKELWKWAGGDNTADPAKAIGTGITGKTKTTYGDVLREMDPNHPTQAAIGGILGDIILDPLNLIPASWIAAPIKMGAKGVALTTKVGREANAAAKTLRDAEQVAKTEREAATSAASAETNPVSEVSADTGIPEEKATSIVDQVVGQTKAEEAPKVATPAPPVEATPVATAAEATPSPVATATPETNIEDFFPDFTKPPETIAPEVPQRSLVDDITEAKTTDPTIEAKPPVSEEATANHIDEILKGKTEDIDNIRQSDQMNKLIKNARQTAKGADFAERQAMATDKAVKDFATQAEASRVIGNEPFVATAEGKRYPISMDQSIRVLADNGHDDAVTRGLFNTAHEIGPHAFNAGVAEVLRHADEGTGLLRDEVVDSVVDAMNNATSGTYHKIHAEHQSPYVRNQWEANSTQARRDLAEAMVDSIDDLVDVTTTNKARYSKRVAQETETLKKVTNERVTEAMKPSTSASEAAETVNDIPKAQKQAAEEIKATPEAKVNGSVESIQYVTDAGIDAKSTEAASKKANASATGDKKTIEDVNKKEADRAVKDFDEIGKKAQPDYVHDLDAQNAVQLEGIIERITNWFGTKFLANYGAAQLADMWRVKKSFNSSTAARFGNVLNSLAKEYKPSDIQEAWKILRDATKTKNPAGLTEEMKGLVEKLNVAVGAIYDFRGMGNSPFYTSFLMQGYPWDKINRALSRRNVGFNFKTVKDGKPLSRTEIASQYLDWDVQNPLEFIHNSFEALRDLATNQAIADHVVQKWGVTSPRAGYVRLSSSKGESELFDFFPKKTTYYIPKEAASQIQNLEKMMKASTSFKGQPGHFARFMNDTVDPMIQLWKTLVTIVRPSHHMRNLVGDMSASWLDGVYGEASYRKSMGMLISQRQKKSFEDQVRQIQGLISPHDAKQILNPKFNVKLKGGKTEQLDDVMMHRLAYQSGILPLFTSIEDIVADSNRGLGRLSSGLLKSKPVKFAGNISEKTSHLGRLSHWNALMERSSFTSKFSSLEEASMAASKRVRLFHPDSSGLTAFEQKYMRRMFPFYSWFRQAAPTFAARLVTKPARFNDLNKVQYEFAKSMGVNPQSLGDPFPEDKEFPSWLRSSITGPWTKGGMMMNFGTPVETLAGLANQTPETTQSGNPQIVEQLLNMLNPAIKAPIELTAGSMVTNRPIADKSEYIDSMIPGASTVGRAFGSWSPSGTVMNILTGQNTGGPGPIDPIKNVIRDGNNRWFNQGLLNFLVGISANDAYSPTSQKIANAERLTRVNGGG